MKPLQPIGGVVALGIAVGVLGSAYALATGALGETRAVATVALVAAVVLGLAIAGARSRRWLSGEYW